MKQSEPHRTVPAGEPEAPVAPPVEETPPPAEARPDASEQAVATDLDELLARAERERDEYLSLAQRTQADFENFRKRMRAEVGGAELRGVGRLAKELLPALDNLELALRAAPEDDKVAEGMKLVHKELHQALTRAGIQGFSPEGERFDPNEHEAMSQVPVEGAESGTVAEVYQRGYRLDGTVLRPARVVVAS